MTNALKPINGDRNVIAVDRARAELRHGRAIVLRDAGRAYLVGCLEALQDDVSKVIQEQAVGQFTLLLNWRRAEVLGTSAGDESPVKLTLTSPDDNLECAQELAYGARVSELDLPTVQVIEDDNLAISAIALARLAQLSPAVMIADVSDRLSPDLERALTKGDVISVNVSAVEAAESFPRRVRRVSGAPVPIVDGVETRFIAFRGPMPSDEQMAVIIGDVDVNQPVPIRVHSSCLTGDVFGSLRCDCGEQLDATIVKLTAMGGGIVLYLAQEGRGIGLTNKLRAYELQDAGVDTYDANAHLGFEPDERRFDIAASMLAQLDIKSVRLLTNNPRKVDELRAEGIDVVDRVPLTGGLTRHNARYLRAKVEKGGHFGEAARGRVSEELVERDQSAEVRAFPTSKIGF